jgi:hypothetical protein
LSRCKKHSICAQTRIPGVSVAQVARRYAMNANLIHKWLRDPRFTPDEAAPETQGAAFLPVEIAGIAPLPSLPQLPAPPTISGAPLSAQRVDITLYGIMVELVADGTPNERSQSYFDILQRTYGLSSEFDRLYASLD